MNNSFLTYRPEIDGLRAFAILPVILFHLGYNWIPGGYIGVDVFFVISGLLITSILLKSYIQGTFSFKDFWFRRIRRILPVLLLVVLVTLVVGRYLLYAPDIYHLGHQGIASLLSYANISQWLTAGNYWGYSAENSPLLHTWSLSVEEQFYLVFPIFIFVTLKYFKKWLAPIVLVLSILSYLLFVYGSKHHPDATFYLLPTRAWELGIGAFLAIFLFNNPDFIKIKKPAALQILSLSGLLAVLISYFVIDGSNGLSAYMIIPVIGAGFIIVFSNSSENIVNRVLSLPLLVYIGKISYSLYLWHWPVLVLAKNFTLKTDTEIPVVLLLGLILLLSILSYHFIETPTRKNPKAVPLVLIALIVGVIYSYSLTTSDYVEDISMYKQTHSEGQLYTSNPIKIKNAAKIKKSKGIQYAINPNRNWQAYKEGGVINYYGEKSPEIVVLGDSHAVMWSGTLDKIAKQLDKSIAFYATEGTPTFFDIPVKSAKKTIYFSEDQKRAYDEARLKYLKLWKPEIVMISHNWSDLESMKSTHDLIHFLGEIGAKVLLLEQPPVLFFGDKNAPQFLSYYGLKPVEKIKQYVPYLNSPLFKRGRKLVRDIAASCNYCELIPITDIYLKEDSNEDFGWVLDGDEVLYIDDDHLSSAGTLKAKDRILNSLESKFIN